jgi:membrane protease YdiL (CAAX protease family)
MMADQIDNEKPANKNRQLIVCDVLALIFTMGFPSLMSWLEFVALRGQEGNQAIQAIFWLGKALQFSFPLVYVWFRAREKLHFEGPNKRGLMVGIVFGLIVSGGAMVMYFGWLRTSPAFAGTPHQVRRWLFDFNPFFGTPFGYLVMAALMAIVHSFLEEYYWRWFVFGWLKKVVPLGAAMLLSSFAFMAHHVIVLNVYLQGYFWEAVVPFSLCVAGGGIAWAWLYQRCGSLVAPWVSHLLIDAALMGLGYDMVFVNYNANR